MIDTIDAGGSRTMATREAPDVLTTSPAPMVPVVTGGRERNLLAFEPQSFRWVWPPWQPPPGEGLVAIANQADATLGWADALLARHGSDLYVWAAVGGEPLRHALDILDRPGVVAATMAWNHADPRKVSIALEVAAWLASQRAESHIRGCLTAWSPPAPPPGILRVPRLVTLLDGSTATDTVVWELLPDARLREGLGAPLPDLTLVESNLDALIEFRAMLRTGRVPATPVTARVLDLIALDGHHDLSIELVIEHLDLFWVLFDAMTTGRRTHGRDTRRALAPSNRSDVAADHIRRSR
jgi:hypothetical protein